MVKAPTQSPISVPDTNKVVKHKKVPVLKVKIKQHGKVIETVRLKGQQAIDYLKEEGKSDAYIKKFLGA